MTTVSPSDLDARAVERFASRLFGSTLAALELANIHLGIRLGLYDVLTSSGPVTAADLAGRAGIAARYAREWLEEQAVAEVIHVVDDDVDADRRTFELPAAHALVLTDDDNDASMKACAALVPWLGTAIDLMIDAYRSGDGVPFGAFALHEVQAGLSRPAIRNHLTQTWLPAVPAIQQRLDVGDALRIAELGCGAGFAAITIAQAYPAVHVDGFDLDDKSIDAARRRAAAAGVADRVRFHVADAAGPLSGVYDLVLAIEMLHDVSDPVGVLRTMRRLAPGGEVLVVDERTADRFGIPASPTERLLYACSTLHCLSISMQCDGAGTGTVMRADRLRGYATAAGFDAVEILAVEHPQLRLYRLR